MTRRWLHWRRRPAPAGPSCREVVELVTAYLEDALAPADRARFEAHIAACEHCAAYLEQLRATIAVAGRIAPEALSQDMERDLLAAFEAYKKEGRG